MRKTDELDLKLIQDFHNGKEEECIKELFYKYLPLILGLWSRYPFSDLELDDWKQECTIILIRNLKKYHKNMNNSFGTLFKSSVFNRYKDQLRRRNAMKRIPEDKMIYESSIEEQGGVYTVRDKSNIDPLRNLDTKIIFELLIKELTDFELEVLKSNLIKINNENCEAILNMREQFCRKYKDGDRQFMNCRRNIRSKLREVIDYLQVEWDNDAHH